MTDQQTPDTSTSEREIDAPNVQEASSAGNDGASHDTTEPSAGTSATEMPLPAHTEPVASSDAPPATTEGEEEVSTAEHKRRAKEAGKIFDRAESVASKVLGAPVGIALMAQDAAVEMLTLGTQSLLELLEKLGDSAGTYEYIEQPDDGGLEDGLVGADDAVDANAPPATAPRMFRYELVNLFTLEKKQRRAIADIIDEAIAESARYEKEMIEKSGKRPVALRGESAGSKFINGSLDLARLIQALERIDGDSKLFAQLYVPKGYRYSATRAGNPEYIARFDRLSFGQQLGAIFRFFTSSASWLPDDILTQFKNVLAKVLGAKRNANG